MKLVVYSQSSEVFQPCERSFNDPSFWDDLEFGRTFIRSEHDFKFPSELVKNSVRKNFLDDTLVLPLAEVVIHTLPRSKILGNHAPLTACFEKIQNRIHDVSERMFSFSFLRIDDFFNNLPLFISKVG